MGYGIYGLTFNTLRGGNKARLPQFKNKHGEPAHSKADGSDWSDAQWLQAVVGELMNQVVKGLKRDGYTKANKSWLLRQALHAFDTTKLPPPENY